MQKKGNGKFKEGIVNIGSNIARKSYKLNFFFQHVEGHWRLLQKEMY